jgi:hypothetical protein
MEREPRRPIVNGGKQGDAHPAAQRTVPTTRLARQMLITKRSSM